MGKLIRKTAKMLKINSKLEIIQIANKKKAF